MVAKFKLLTRPPFFLSLGLAIVLVMTGCQSGTDQLSANGSGTTPPPPSGGGGGGGGGTTPPPSPPPAGSASVALDWDSPTTNVDQSCLTNLSGYVISYGTSPGVYSVSETIPVGSVGLTCGAPSTVTACGTVQTCTYTVRGLSLGQWYFSAAAYNTDFVTSPASNEASVTLN